MTDRLLQDRNAEKQTIVEQGETDYELKPLTVWTSTRRRTIETAKYLHERGFKVRQRSQLSQMNPGVCEKMSERRIREEYADEVAKHELDPYHHRYPRAEVSRYIQTINGSVNNYYLPVVPWSCSTTWAYYFGTWKGTERPSHYCTWKCAKSFIWLPHGVQCCRYSFPTIPPGRNNWGEIGKRFLDWIFVWLPY